MTYDLLSYLKDCRDNNSSPDDAVYETCCSVDISELRKIRDRIIQIRALSGKHAPAKRAKEFRGRQSKHVGLLLERLMLKLLVGCSILPTVNNIRTTMAEVDYLVTIGPLAAVIPMFQDAGTHSIGEAKCVSGALKTEWVNELVGLLSAHGATLGLLFTAAPSKKLVVGLRTTLTVHAAKGFNIVPFGLAQLEQVIAGDNFLKVLSQQYVRVRTSSTDLEI